MSAIFKFVLTNIKFELVLSTIFSMATSELF
jgi:hypothetical protein